MKTSAPAVDFAGVLKQLDDIAPSAPLLGLGQTVFWDEPMKAALAQASMGTRRFVAGVHDTDYFAKLPGRKGSSSGFAIVAHNDSSTKELWSAAAEFSAVFGSETVVKREILQAAGLRLRKVSEGRPALLEQATEAWGWRAVVSLSDNPPITAEVPLQDVWPELRRALDWAIQETLACVSEAERVVARDRAELLLREADAQSEAGGTLSEFYQRLLPFLYRFVCGSDVEIEVTATTELLRFNSKTYTLPRFDLVNMFVEPDTAATSAAAYNQAVAGSEIYGLDRFGTGAIPFDLVVPGQGRGTVRIARRAIVIMAQKPIFVPLTSPIKSVKDFAEAIEARLGPNCVLVGKAVTLIGMLAREFVFVFHEGASGYLPITQRFHENLKAQDCGLRWNPILRVRHAAWDSLAACHSWLHLPEPLRKPFGSEDICAPSFAMRWREVAGEQGKLLSDLGKLKSPLDLIRFLDDHAKGSWRRLSDEYHGLHDRLGQMAENVEELRQQRRALYAQLRQYRQDRVHAERAKGDHFRSRIFQREASTEDLQERVALQHKVEEAIRNIAETEHEIRMLLRRQTEEARDPAMLDIHERRRAIEVEAELKRLRLIRDAVITSKGLAKANHRPSAWWFPVVCTDGGWFAENSLRAECYLEPIG